MRRNVLAEIEKIITFTQQFYGCHYSIVRLNSTFARRFFVFLWSILSARLVNLSLMCEAARIGAVYYIRIE